MADNAYLSVKGITKRFGGIVAVEQVSFEINKGEVVSIIGPNGAGKTTVFNMLTGVYQVDEGTILFNGEEIQNKKPKHIVMAGMSRTFQNIRLFQDMRVIENVLIGAHIKKLLTVSLIPPSVRRDTARKRMKRYCRPLNFLNPWDWSTEKMTMPPICLMETRGNWKLPGQLLPVQDCFC